MAVVVVAAGALFPSPPAQAAAGSFAATCVTTGGIHGPTTDHRTFTFSAHAPDSVAPDAPFTVSTDVGYSVPPDASLAASFFDVTGATTEAPAVPAEPGAPSIHGDLVLGATGAVGTAVVVTLREFGSLAYVGPLQVIELCSPDHRLTLASVPIGVPSVSIGDGAIVEGSSGTRTLAFAVTLSRPAATDVTVTFATEKGTGTAGSDFTTLSGSVTVHAGSVSGIARVRVRGDSRVEPTENFRVRLVGPTGAVLGRTVGTGRIIDDDPETGPRISIGDSSVVEGARGTRSARFEVTLSASAPQDVTFHYVTVDGSAVAGVDYRAQESDYHIPAGKTSISVPVPVIADTTSEPTKSFTVRLTTARGAIIGRANGVGTIIDDD